MFEKLKNESGGVDVIVEVVGGRIFKESFKILNPFGRIAIMGFASLNFNRWNPFSWYKTWRDMPRIKIGEVAVKTSCVMGSHLGYLLNDPPKILSIYNDLKSFLIQNKIKPVIGKVFPFEEASKAHQYIEDRKSVGKVLLEIGNV